MKRDWTLARAKVEHEGGRCRICRTTRQVEAAHVIRREYDREPALSLRGSSAFVHPDRIVPLCREHHQEYDAHRLDLLGRLTREEEVQAVADVGLETARIRLCPSAYPSKVAA